MGVGAREALDRPVWLGIQVFVGQFHESFVGMALVDVVHERRPTVRRIESDLVEAPCPPGRHPQDVLGAVGLLAGTHIRVDVRLPQAMSTMEPLDNTQ